MSQPPSFLDHFLERLPGPMAGAPALASGLVRRAAIATRFARRSGVVSALSARGMLSFAAAMPTAGRGPQLAVVLQAKNTPDKLALADLTGLASLASQASLAGQAGERRLSYRAFDQEINRLAHALGELGVRSGDRVALMLPNCAEYVIAQQALLRAGCSAVQIGYRLKAKEIAHILENAGPVAMIAHRDFHAEIDQALRQALRQAQEQASQPAPEHIIWLGARPGELTVGAEYHELLARQRGTRPPRWKDTSQGRVIVYTSGTTGKPKGASRNISDTGLIAFLEFSTRIGVHHNDRHLVVCPLYHSAAPVFASLILSVGASLFILDHFDVERVLATIERERITCAFMVPTMLRRLADAPAAVRDRYDTSSLRWIVSGAAPLSTDTAVRFQQLFGPILFNFYGSTETGVVTLAEPDDHASHPGTVGRALFGNDIRLLDDHGHEVPMGEVGELYVRNNMLMNGYHGNEQATEQALRDGFFSVGDLARVDADGFYYLESRKHDMIISGGINIYPREIEDFLHEHPDIEDVAIIGVPDPEWGESVVAFVVLRHGAMLDEAGIIQLCRDNLASYKRPRQVHFVDELPHNPTGKVLKRELRARAQQAQTTTSSSP